MLQGLQSWAHCSSVMSNKLPPCGWRGYEREEKEGEREVDNLSTCGCVIQLYLWENT